MKEIMERVVVEVERGLSKKTHNEADVKCFVTYVQDLPNGKGLLGVALIRTKGRCTLLTDIYVFFFIF